MWERVVQIYNSQKLATVSIRAPERDIDAIRNKWKALKNAKKPTGDPTCPPDVIRAKRLAKEIDSSVLTFSLGQESSSDDDSPISDSNSEASSVQSDVQQRAAIYSNVDETFDYAYNEEAVSCSEQYGPENEDIADSQPVEVIDDAQNVDKNADRIIPDSFAAAGNLRGKSSDELPGNSGNLQRSLLPVDAAQKPNPKRSQIEAPCARLGASVSQLKGILNDIQADEHRKKKIKSKHNKGIPPNPTHSQKSLLTQELQELDEQFSDRKRMEDNVALAQLNATITAQRLQFEAQKMQHEQAMKKMDQKRELDERKFEAEKAAAQEKAEQSARRHETMMAAFLAGITALTGTTRIASAFTSANPGAAGDS
jgi:hypothetical protein